MPVDTSSKVSLVVIVYAAWNNGLHEDAKLYVNFQSNHYKFQMDGVRLCLTTTPQKNATWRSMQLSTPTITKASNTAPSDKESARASTVTE